MTSRIQSKTKYAIKEKRKCDLNQEKKSNLQWLYSELTKMRCLNCYREVLCMHRKQRETCSQ